MQKEYNLSLMQKKVNTNAKRVITCMSAKNDSTHNSFFLVTSTAVQQHTYLLSN
jgi:hypothetical protein